MLFGLRDSPSSKPVCVLSVLTDELDDQGGGDKCCGGDADCVCACSRARVCGLLSHVCERLKVCC